MTEIENLYSVLGGRFVTPVAQLQEKLAKIKAFVFDWDGVFNNGQKTSSGGSTFSEVDSMGTNLLRYSWFLKHGTLPYTAVLSGEKNETAHYFSQREGFHASFFKVPHKRVALDYICKTWNLQPDEIAFFFDDVLDIPLAEVCGIRMQVNQGVNPMFTNYCKKNNLVDYLTSVPGGQFAVREATELLIGLCGNYEEVITGRKNNIKSYQEYISQRREMQTGFYTLNESGIEQVSL